MSGVVKRTIFCLLLFSMLASFFCFLCLAEPEVPLPANSIQLRDRHSTTGFHEAFRRSYETDLPAARVTSFFQKEMPSSGWKQASTGKFFTKDGYLAIIFVNPYPTKTNKTRFSVAISRIPTMEDLRASSKEIPDKLDFMPLYPESTQSFLADIPNGVSAAYVTSDDIKEVDFFYKSAMLKYGWEMQGESSGKPGLGDCPGCKKLTGENAGVPSTVKTSASMNELRFTKANGDSCTIRLFYTSASGVGQEAPQGKTTISVTYIHAKKLGW
jgi:hypothetical protein